MTMYVKGLFDADENIIKTTDIEPAISYDHVNRIVEGFKSLMTVLGVNNIRKIQNGKTINLYKVTVGNIPAQVAEGEDVPLTKVERKPFRTITIALKKYRKAVTAEAIQEDGYEHAVNDTDNKLTARVRGVVKGTFYENLALGTGTAAGGANLQAALSSVKAAISKKNEDADVTPVFFVNTDDLYTFLGNQPVSTQSAFGFDYIEKFLGLGDVIVTASVAAGTVIGTVKENLHAAAPDNGSDVARALGFTTDPSGVVLMKHTQNSTNFSLETALMTGITFYAEDLDQIFKGTIAQG